MINLFIALTFGGGVAGRIEFEEDDGDGGKGGKESSRRFQTCNSDFDLSVL